MNHAKIRIREEDLLKLVLDFLTSRNFNVSMRTLEKESGVVNSPYTEDILFLRELILDGDWDEVLLFAQPFDGLVEFDSKQFKYLILKQKFLELLSLKSHIVSKQTENSIEDVMRTLNLLEENCPSKEEYSNLCWLLTVPNLSERSEFKNWTLDNSRLKCFTAVLDVVCKVPTLHRKAKQSRNIAMEDRLLQLVVKGLFYETCIEYCQSKATGTKTSGASIFSVRTNVLQGIADDYSANLLSWVRNLDDEVFNQPFEQVSVEIVLEKLAKFDKNLRHSVDVPKKGRRESNDENMQFRSLSNLDPAMAQRKPKVNRNKQSQLISAVSPMDELNFHLADDEKGKCKEDIVTECPVVKESDVVKNDGQKRQITANTFRVSDQLLDSGKVVKSNNLNTVLDTNGSIEAQENNAFGPSMSNSENFEQNVNLFTDAKSDSKGENDRMVIRTSSIKQSVDEETFQVEERKRRESVMKKLEEYENRKKLMQMQLDQMSQGLGKSDMSSEDIAPAGITSSTGQTVDAPSNRQYITARDLVTDYDLPSRGLQSDAETKKAANDKVDGEEKQYSNQVHPTMKEEEEKGESTDIPNHINARIDSMSKLDSIPSKKHTESSKTPRNNGFFVNLSDGSGKMSTSTPKAKRHVVTETPPPEASPVKPLDRGSRTPKAVPKGAIRTQVTGNYQSKPKASNQSEKKGEVIDAKTVERDEKVSHEKGKENVSKDGNYSRKGPVINGVRRTLVSSPQHVIQPNHDSEAFKTGNLKANPLKTVTGDAVKSPLETRNTEEKPIVKTADNTANIKGPGPKIKTRDGSKVLVTELLKSREEIKNATANKQRYGSPEVEENLVHHSDNQEGQLKEPDARLNFKPVCLLEDSQAIRAVSFHPDGKLFAIGSNSKILRVCMIKNFQPVISHEGEGIPPPSIVFKRNKYHKGSIYCMTWNPLGDIIATGSNDKSIKLLRFDPDNFVQENAETDVNIHNGTVRELSFVPDKPAILVSGGAGDGGVHITDCSTYQTIGTLRGHTGNVMAVYASEGDIIATGSTDNTLRLWDLRSHRCIDVVLVGDSCPASVALSHSGSYLASGQEDGCILLYDISAGRTLQSFRLHQEDCRSVRFSPDSKYLLTGSYDGDISLLHTKGDLEFTVPQHYKVAAHKDKVIQCRWHPNRYSFLSSSADRTAIVWSPDVDRNLLLS